MRLGDILPLLQNVKKSGSGYSARCPCHDDHNNSLSIGVGKDQRILIHCHAGCPTDTILNRLGLSQRDLFPEQAAVSTRRRIAATYDYVDTAGELLCQVIRYDPKGFTQRRPDGRGGYIYKLDGVPRVLYRLPEIHARPAETIYIVEGEKDVETLRASGLLATTNSGGAGKWRDEYNDTLRRS